MAGRTTIVLGQSLARRSIYNWSWGCCRRGRRDWCRRGSSGRSTTGCDQNQGQGGQTENQERGSLLSHLQKKLLEAHINLNSARGTYLTDHPRIKELENTVRLYQREIGQHRRGSAASALAANTADADAVRYEGKTLQEWLLDLRTERSSARLRTAVDALAAFGEGDYQQQVARAFLEMMRERNYNIRSDYGQKDVSFHGRHTCLPGELQGDALMRRIAVDKKQAVACANLLHEPLHVPRVPRQKAATVAADPNRVRNRG